MENQIAQVMGISRHRLAIDGKGVTTLVAFYGCPLHCAYCLNPHCNRANTLLQYFYPTTLYEKVKIDDLYFVATGGGITFGGGEPALYSSFIAEFRNICNPEWNINLETSLNVPLTHIRKLHHIVNHFIIDIKDINDEIYQQYTGRSNLKVIANLRWLVEQGAADKITVRVPNIPNYNTAEDVRKSVVFLQELGIQDVDIFNYVIK